MMPTSMSQRSLKSLLLILPEYRGGGFASEASRGLVEHAFSELGVEWLVASMSAENAASVKVAERLGMTL